MEYRKWQTLFVIIFIGLLIAGAFLKAFTLVEYVIWGLFLFFIIAANQLRTAHINKIRYSAPVVDSHLFSQNDLLIERGETLTYQALLFHPKGDVIGTIEDDSEKISRWVRYFTSFAFWVPFRAHVKDKEGNIVAAIVRTPGWNSSIELYEPDGTLIGSYKERLSFSGELKGTFTFQDGNGEYELKGDAFFLKLLNEQGKTIAEFKQGWMPVEWQQRFKDPNLAIIHFHPEATVIDRKIFFGICLSLVLAQR
ncbi:MAG: hypothetical protein H0Z31_09475 [Bacillus sp. (in: Bacteria)]|nr:hypothetical protein [Bacillus sp. (in: firmicutes)]